MPNPPNVYVVGEALVDIIVRPDGSLTSRPGGGPFNAARAASRLGACVEFAGLLSTDHWGDHLAALLAEDDVSLFPAARCDLPTTLAVATLRDTGAAAYTFYATETSAAALRPADIAVPQNVDVLIVGTLGFVLEPLGDATAASVASVADRTLVIVDPNCRPSITRDPDRYRNNVFDALSRADIVKVSDEDLAFLFADQPPPDTESAAHTILTYGPSAVVITAGPDDIYISTSSASCRLPVPHVEVQDTVGAGDTFVGAFAAHWVNHQRSRRDAHDLSLVADTARFAIIAAAVTCTREGCDPPTQHEMRPC